MLSWRWHFQTSQWWKLATLHGNFSTAAFCRECCVKTNGITPASVQHRTSNDLTSGCFDAVIWHSSRRRSLSAEVIYIMAAGGMRMRHSSKESWLPRLNLAGEGIYCSTLHGSIAEHRTPARLASRELCQTSGMQGLSQKQLSEYKHCFFVYCLFWHMLTVLPLNT